MSKSSRKKLIAIGCSYTGHYTSSIYAPGFDFSFPRWPKLLADKLDMECINLGRSGVGNEFMLFRLLDTILTEKKEDIGLVVLMWSEWQRMDFNVEIKKRFRGYLRTRRTPATFSPHKNNQDSEVFPMDEKGRSSMLQYNNTINATGRSIRFFTLAHKILEDIPYIMIQGCFPLVGRKSRLEHGDRAGSGGPPVSARISTVQREAAKELIQGKYFDKILEPNFIGWPVIGEIGGYCVDDVLDKNDPEREFLRISKDDSHPNSEGHRIIAQEIHDEYAKIYS